ncbi:ATP-binding protein [Rhizobium sp. S95]|uniref:histidine kinase n=1 Tax=Ciceribacter sichuanensis TaxID=2949647 RepID=A0AAJ1F9J7_9HYPH|nr:MULTISPECIES: ATP-binding protein [unclassified Ciceribacter]MCM2398098.1 ATP-binding protein [Ciceribacter sp. S95]MCO5959449.1 ATP-binding protein [Ciceribacter sp. S101]
MTKVIDKTDRPAGEDLAGKVSLPSVFALDGSGEAMWVDVIHRMEEVYSELLRNETDLERKNAELEEAQTFISSVVASVSDILIACGRDGVIHKVNPAFLTLVGMEEAKVIGTRIFDYVIEADRKEAERLMSAGQQGRVLEGDLHFRAAADREECLAMRCAALFDSRRRRLGAVLTGRPISELRQAYQALHQAHLELQTAQRKLIEQEKMASLGRLVAGVAHELNNPISFVYANIYTLDRYRKNLVSYLDAVHQGAGDDEIADLRRGLKIDSILSDIAPLLEGTLEGADRVSEIVKNLRRLSFSETGERHAVDLDRVLRNSTHLAVRAKNAMAEVSIDSDANLFVDAHEGQIHQVLVNLIANALDAVADRQNGRVDISTRQRGDSVEIVVSDNGPGIAETEMNKVFEPFFTTKDVGEGTGLGLWITFTIVQDYNGEITVRNNEAGGAEFHVLLPLAR